MESIIPAGGFQLPFQRQLSRLYNDTKKSSDFVKEPVQHEDDPEIKALYRKLRIQKDRFVSWGLEWSDPNQSAEIDESLSKAGLSEVVGSIMSTIKDTLAEAEPLWLSSKRVVEGKRPSPDSKAPLVQWDKDRFKDLIRDLTASIDTLYDLSRTRSSGLAARRPARPASKSLSGDGEFRHFESTRMQTPLQIDPETLTPLQPLKRSSSSSIYDKTSRASREVVCMGKAAYADLVRGTSSQPWAPFLLEYAPFDPIYSTTGIMPPMARFEKLSSGLQQDSQRAPTTWTGLPRLFGYFEDMDNSRLGLLYHFPPSFNVLAPEHPPHNPQYMLPTLGDLLLQPHTEPPLEAKFRLAHHMANSVFDLHARGMTHGNLVVANVSFCPIHASRSTAGAGAGAGAGAQGYEIDIRRPLLSSFEIFPDDAPRSQNKLWRHPLDPRPSIAPPHSTPADERILELFSLGTMLLSIGLWKKLDDLGPVLLSPRQSEFLLEKLSRSCGTLYTKAVQACRGAVDDGLAGREDAEVIISAVQTRVSRFLEACCILDGVSGIEERLGSETQFSVGNASTLQPPPSVPEKSLSNKEFDFPSETKKPLLQGAPPAVVAPPAQAQQSLKELGFTGTDSTDSATTKAKMRLYPHVPLPPDVVEKWNMILMPQINTALGSFYRKHPESVEISLESVGPSPHQTRPTVLVVCSSVSKVRGILNKRLGELFDDTTGFALRVCRGHVIRSRRQATTTSSSSSRTPTNKAQGSAEASGSGAEDADDEYCEAVNPEYQERPSNGASIGAWIGDRHLPPVSFGGLVIVDDKTYGMTVHHMLDDPDRDAALPEVMRSSAIPGRLPFQGLASDDDTSNGEEDEEQNEEEDEEDGNGDLGFELSDDETSEPYSETDLTSDYGSEVEEEEDEEDEEYNEPGDIPGIEPGCGEGYIVTQPALEDVEEGFYPCAETEDEDHLDTFTLGELYASSGIRRRQVDGLVHEVDWALFEFAEGRQPDANSIPHVGGAGPGPGPGPGRGPVETSTGSRAAQRRRGHRGKDRGEQQQQQKQPQFLRPTRVAPWSALPGMEVQCVARTSGLQAGKILPALTSVKIYGRTSPSHALQVVSRALSSPSSCTSSTFSAAAPSSSPSSSSLLPAEKAGSGSGSGSRSGARSAAALGIPGDSGAWIVERDKGLLCGHVLAWSQRKRVAYMCPMDVLLRDIAETLEASEVRLPGGEAVFLTEGATQGQAQRYHQDQDQAQAQDQDQDQGQSQSQRQSQEGSRRDSGADAPAGVQIPDTLIRSLSSARLQMGDVGDVSRMTKGMNNVSLGGRGIDVSG